MATFRDRLISLFGSDAGPTQIAEQIGMSYAGFSRIWYEGKLPKADTLLKIKKIKKCSLDWLLTGDGEAFPDATNSSDMQKLVAVNDTLGNPIDLNEFVFIPRYEVFASAGMGASVYDDNPRFPMAFRSYWIKNYIHAAPESLSVITVKGDSMSGVLEDRDVILINHSETMPRDGIYVMRINDELFVKRLQMLPRGIIKVSSANEAYDAFEVDISDPINNVQVIGKVVWLGRTL